MQCERLWKWTAVCILSGRLWRSSCLSGFSFIPGGFDSSHIRKVLCYLVHVFAWILIISSMSALRTVLKQSRLCIPNTTFLVCDIQEKFQPLIYRSETIIKKAAFLNAAFNVLEIPCVITEQYPKALGHTVPEITLFPTTKVFEKREFSMLANEAVAKELEDSGRKQVHIVSIIVSSNIHWTLVVCDRLFSAVSRLMYVYFNRRWIFWILAMKCMSYAMPHPVRGKLMAMTVSAFYTKCELPVCMTGRTIEQWRWTDWNQAGRCWLLPRRRCSTLCALRATLGSERSARCWSTTIKMTLTSSLTTLLCSSCFGLTDGGAWQQEQYTFSNDLLSAVRRTW